MEIYKYLPLASDRMGILWTLSSIEGSCILEFGPAGTTHYAIEGIGSLNSSEGAKTYSTHMDEKDVTFGKMQKLEKAILEINENIKPKYIFVMASSIASIIGADIKATCDVLQDQVEANLIPIEVGGFKGDYAKGVEEALLIVAKNLVKKTNEKKDTYNLLGCNIDQYQFESDCNEVMRMMDTFFNKEVQAVFTASSSVEMLEDAAKASLNIVLRREALPMALWMEKVHGIPYIYQKPYGLEGTLKFIRNISEKMHWEVNEGNLAKEVAQIKKYSMQLKRHFYSYEGCKACAIYGDYDKALGMKALLEEMGLEVDKMQVIHSVKEERIDTGYQERERMTYLKERPLYCLLADGATLKMAHQAKGCLQISNPNMDQSIVYPYTPFVGLRGMLWMIQVILNVKVH